MELDSGYTKYVKPVIDAVSRRGAYAEPGAMPYVTEDSLESAETTMSAPTREEFEARLGEVRAENRELASGLRKDMQSLQDDMRNQFEKLRIELSVGAHESKSSVDLSNAVTQGRIDKFESSLSMFQWFVGLIAAAGAIFVGYEQLKVAQSTPPAAPIVIQIPSTVAAPPAVQPPAPKPPLK